MRTRRLWFGLSGLALFLGGCAQLAGLTEDYYEAEAGSGAAGTASDAAANPDASADGDASLDGDTQVDEDALAEDVFDAEDEMAEAADGEGGACADAGNNGLGTIGEGCCTAGESVCAGHAQKIVLICDPSSMTWMALQACSGQMLCDSAPGMNQGTCQDVVPICVGQEPGANLCEGGVAVECGPDLVTSEETICTSACEGGECVGVCTPEERRCDGVTPQVCDGAGAWLGEAACPYLCTGAGACTGECTPGARQCDGVIPVTCNGSGYWQAGTACPTLCSAGECADACTTGEEQCSGRVPQTCDATGQWQSGVACAYVCQSGACVGVCSPGSQQCVGQVPQTCDAGGQWQSGTSCQYVCAAGVCSGVCTPGAKDCLGLTPRSCSLSGQWQSDTPCTYVCSGGECTGVCSPGGKQCNGLVPQTCDASGHWENGTPCPYTCTAGTCTGSCMPGVEQCNGLVPQTCNASGQWVDGTPCQYVCSAGACSGVCSPGAKQCSGQVPQTCDASGQWQSGTSCQYACSAGACTGVCVPGTKQCAGNLLQTCQANGQWDAGGACTGATPICSGGECVSDNPYTVVPGLYGFGTDTRAAYGGGVDPVILHVDTLASGVSNTDATHGSFEWAITRSYPRVVVFDVSGVIACNDTVELSADYITIAGQTAPGHIVFNGQLTIFASHVLVQHMAFRGTHGSARSNVNITGYDGPHSDIVVDHISASWSTQDGISVSGFGIPLTVADVTIANSIIAEGIEGHSYGTQLDAQNVAILDNLYAHDNNKNPMLGRGAHAVAWNNLMYDISYRVSQAEGNGTLPAPTMFDFRGNDVVQGPESVSSTAHMFFIMSTMTDMLLYMEDNIKYGILIPGYDVQNDPGVAYQTATPPVSTPGFSPLASSTTYSSVMARAGARPGNRDVVDARIVGEVQTQTGGKPSSEPPMPNYLETVQAFVPVANPHEMFDGNYTNLEHQLHLLAEAVE